MNKFELEAEELELEATEPEGVCNEGFVIDTAEKADWAIRKIRFQNAEAERMVEVLKFRMDAIQAQINKIVEDCEQKNAGLELMLIDYMRNFAECKETKTQLSHKLPAATLEIKKASVEFGRDDAAIIQWLKGSGMGDLVKVEVKEKPDWTTLKKQLVGDPATGVVVLEGSGEIVEGVTAQEKPERLNIKFNKGV